MASFNRLNPEDISISTDKIVTNTWSGDVNLLTKFITASTQAVFTSATSQGNFFLEVYGQPLAPAGAGSTATTASVQYTISYGHKEGSGSANFTNTSGALGNTATKCIYNQYRQLVFGDETSEFTFDGVVATDIWVVNVARSRYKHSLKAGSLNLRLNDGTNRLDFTDDSKTSSGSATITNIGRQFNLVSGSDGVRLGTTLSQTDSGSYGFFYPDAGIIIFNGNALRVKTPAYWLAGGSYTAQKLNEKMYTAMSKSSADTGFGFEVDSEERVSSQYNFIRVKNSEFNYSSNPSYIDNNGNLNNDTFADSPVTYITTIGLYNDDNNLLAVAKLSQPLKKDFTTETLVRVKLDY